MNSQWLWLLSIVLILGFSSLADARTRPIHLPPSECRCKVDPKERKNCGPPGITPEQCNNKGCCFNSEVVDVPWCFAPTPPKYMQVCPSDVKMRTDCGYPGISAEDCEKRGCCFNSRPPGVPWCFFHILVPEEC